MTDLAFNVTGLVLVHATVVLAGAWLIVWGRTAPSAASVHATWTTAFVLLLLLPLGTILVPGWTFSVPIDSSPPATSRLGSEDFHEKRSESLESFLGAPSDETVEGDGGIEASERSSSSESVQWGYLYRWGERWLPPVMLLIWSGGVLLLLGRLVVGLWGLWRWKQSAREVECTGLVETLMRRLDLQRSVSVRYSAEASMPVVWGILRPVIILPAAATEWSRGRLRSVLLHEMAHVARWDPLTHLVIRVARSCFWPNPLVWTADRAAAAAQERACDDVVLRSGITSWEYAEHLLAVTKTFQQNAVPTEAVALENGRSFKSRIRALLESTTNRRALTNWETALFVIAGSVLFVLVSAVQVQFSSSAHQGTWHRIEAEQTTLRASMRARSSEDASAGTYLHVAEGAARLDRPPSSDPTEYTFDVAEEGSYVIWARVRAPSDDHNSLWLRVDSTRWIRWNGIEEGNQWHWVQVRDDADQRERPVAFDLASGTHRLHIGPREEGIDVDQFLVTDDWTFRPRATESSPGTTPGEQVWLEAEEGELEAPFRVEHAPEASGWRHVVARPESESRSVPPSKGRISYSFRVEQAGSYHLWGRVHAPNSGMDSFWIRVDDGSWIRWNDIRKGEQWQWDQVHDADEQNAPVQFDLAEGLHHLTIAYRERDAKIDRLLLTTNASYRPRGIGARLQGNEPFSQRLRPQEAALTAPMELQADSQSSSSGSWIGVPDGPGNDAPEGGPGTATWTFSVPEAGDYVLWGDVYAPVTNDNSFYVSMDGHEEIAWHTPAPGATTDEWLWDPVSRLDAAGHTDPVVFSLDAGRHRLRIRNREDGTRLRQLRVTNMSTSGPIFVRP